MTDPLPGEFGKSWFYLTLETEEAPAPPEPESPELQRGAPGHAFTYGPVSKEGFEEVFEVKNSLVREFEVALDLQVELRIPRTPFVEEFSASASLSKQFELETEVIRQPSVHLARIHREDEELLWLI